MESHHSALLRFHDGLRDSGVTWALTASLNLTLRGVDIEPSDIDVMTNARGADTIESIFADHVVRPVTHSHSREKRIGSWFGILELDGTEIEIMGDIRHFVDGKWTTPTCVTEHREFIELDEQAIPVMSLEHELAAYRNLGRGERVKQVETLL
jgi:hypothetical protein